MRFIIISSYNIVIYAVMATPLTLEEQQKETYYAADVKLVVYVATSKYDAVSIVDQLGKTVQALQDLPDSKADCAAFRTALDQYHITDAGPGDIYRIEDNPSSEHKDAILLSIKKRLRDNPTKKFLIVFVLAGHGMQQGSRQVLLLNEFKEKASGRGFYSTWSAESDIRDMARTFPNSYSIAFFTSRRQILAPKRLDGFKSKKGASTAASSVGDEDEEAKDGGSETSAGRQNVALFFGCNPGPQSASMIPQILDKLTDKYEKDTFSVLFPDAFEQLQGRDFELVKTNALQSIRLFYEDKVVKTTLGAIFVHKDENDREYANCIEKAKKARSLLEEELDFLNVQIHINLPKLQVIEKLDQLQSQADGFEQNHGAHDNLAVALVNIGYAFNPGLYPLHQKKAEAEGYTQPAKDAQGIEYCPQYIFTHDEELINVTEYACRLAAGPATHVIQLDECEPNAFPDWKREWHELVLEARTGRPRHTYVKQCNIEQLYTSIKGLREEPLRNAFQVPLHITEVGADVQEWSAEPEQIIVGQRYEPKEMVANNQLNQTLKQSNDYWKGRPKLIQQELSVVEWKPSVHSLPDQLLHIVGQDKANDGHEDEMDEIPEENKGNSLYHSSISNISRQQTRRMIEESEGDVAFIFRENKQPYKEIRRIQTSKEHYQSAAPIVDRRADDDRDEHFQLAVLSTPEEHNNPCKFLNLTTEESCKPTFDEREIFRNCFVTEGSNILLFTRYYIIVYESNFKQLARIDKKTIHEHVWRMNCCQPYLSSTTQSSYLLACEMKNFFKAKFKKEHPQHVYAGKKTEPTWVVKCEFNNAEQKIEYKMSDSILIIDQKVDSICEVMADRQLVKLQSCNALLVVGSWQVLHRIEIQGAFTLEKGLLLPGFHVESFPFFVSYGEDTFDLVNLSTGRIEPLIQGSAANLYGQRAAFFTSRGVGKFDFDFCTSGLTPEGKIESNWYKMTFNPDFTETLRDYGQLPIASIKESLDIVKERDALKVTIEHVGLHDDKQKDAIAQFQQLQQSQQITEKQRLEHDEVKQLNVHLVKQLTKQSLIAAKERNVEKEETKQSQAQMMQQVFQSRQSTQQTTDQAIESLRKAQDKDLARSNEDHEKRYSQLLEEKAESEKILKQKAKTELAQAQLQGTLKAGLLTQSIEQFKQTMNDRDGTIFDHEETIKAKEDELKGHQNEIEKLNKLVKQRQQQSVELQVQLKDSQSRLSEAEGKLKDQRQELEKSQEDCRHLDTELASVKSQLEATKSELSSDLNDKTAENSQLKEHILDLEAEAKKSQQASHDEHSRLTHEISRLQGEMESSTNQLGILQANSGDQVSQLQAEIKRLKEEHHSFIEKLQSESELEKSNMVAESNAQTGKTTHHYEEKLKDLERQKDAQKDQIRSELQQKIDDLNHQLDTERQQITAAGKQREEELLSQVDALRRQTSDRDMKITNLGTQIIQLQFQIKERDITMMSHGMTIQQREETSKKNIEQLERVTGEYDTYKASSKRDYEDMQANLKERHSLEIDSLKVKHDVAVAELSHASRTDKELLKSELDRQIRELEAEVYQLKSQFGRDKDALMGNQNKLILNLEQQIKSLKDEHLQRTTKMQRSHEEEVATLRATQRTAIDEVTSAMKEQREHELTRVKEMHESEIKDLGHSREKMLRSLNDNFDQQLNQKDQRHSTALAHSQHEHATESKRHQRATDELRRTVTDLGEQLSSKKRQLQDTESLIKGEADLVEVNTTLKRSLTMTEEKQGGLAQAIAAERKIAEKERLEKEQANETNADLLKKILQLSLSKFALMRKVEKYEQTSKKGQAEQESVKQIITYVLSGQIDSSFLKEVGGISWGELKVKRQDPDFDHMAFWKALTQEDQSTLMDLLKEEQDESKPSDQHQHWANSLLEKIEAQKATNERERQEREDMMLANQRLSQQIEETKGLHDTTRRQSQKLKEKDKIIEQLVKAQVRASMTAPSSGSFVKDDRTDSMVNAGSFISDSSAQRKTSQRQVDASDVKPSGEKKKKSSSGSGAGLLATPDAGNTQASTLSPSRETEKSSKERKRERSKEKKSSKKQVRFTDAK